MTMRDAVPTFDKGSNSSSALPSISSAEAMTSPSIDKVAIPYAASAETDNDVIPSINAPGLAFTVISTGLSVLIMTEGSPKKIQVLCVLPASLGCASKIFMLPFSARPPRVCLYESVPICSHMMFTISSCPVIGGVQGCEIHENIPPRAPVGAFVELFVARSHASPKQVPSNCPLLHA